MSTRYIQIYPSTAAFLALCPARENHQAFGYIGGVLYTNVAGAAVPIARSSASRIEDVTAANVITAEENGKTFFLNSTTEFISTLPAPAAGLKFKFVVKAAPSSASYTIVTHDGSDLIHGLAASAEDAAGAVDSTAGTPADTITFADGLAVVGDCVEVESDGTYWYATGFCNVQDAITFTQS